MSTFIEERTYHPTGMDLSVQQHQWESHSFQVVVAYRGNGKWCVARSREAHEQLTQTGRWVYSPLKMTAVRWCRFSFDEACDLAESVVDSVKVNGRTWAEWQQHWEAA